MVESRNPLQTQVKTAGLSRMWGRHRAGSGHSAAADDSPGLPKSTQFSRLFSESILQRIPCSKDAWNTIAATSMVRLAKACPITQRTKLSGAQRGLEHSPAETLSPLPDWGDISLGQKWLGTTSKKLDLDDGQIEYVPWPDLLVLLTFFVALLTFVCCLVLLLAVICMSLSTR